MKKKETIWSETIDHILESGVLLKSDGVNNYALTRSQAIEALDDLLRLNIIVLGGDVYSKHEGKFVPNYDNWHYEINNSEVNKCFISINTAKKYIVNYPKIEAYFCLVPLMDPK